MQKGREREMYVYYTRSDGGKMQRDVQPGVMENAEREVRPEKERDTYTYQRRWKKKAERDVRIIPGKS